MPVPSVMEAVTAHFLIPLLFPVNCSYLNPDLYLLCLQFSSLAHRKEGGVSEWQNTEVGDTIPKPQHQMLIEYKFLESLGTKFSSFLSLSAIAAVAVTVSTLSHSDNK